MRHFHRWAVSHPTAFTNSSNSSICLVSSFLRSPISSVLICPARESLLLGKCLPRRTGRQIVCNPGLGKCPLNGDGDGDGDEYSVARCPGDPTATPCQTPQGPCLRATPVLFTPPTASRPSSFTLLLCFLDENAAQGKKNF